MEHIKILENINLLKKYDVYAFDYIEYPHKSFWRNSIKNEEIEKKLEDLCKSEEPTMLYIHIPFCEQLCIFCICHRQITSDYNVAMSGKHFSNLISSVFDTFIKSPRCNYDIKV